MALTDKIIKIADKTRELTGLTNKMTLDEIPSNMDLIKTKPNLQNKIIEIIENGTTNIVADEGYDGLNNVEVVTNVKGESEQDELIYSELEYLESNSDYSQYLQTNYKLNSNSRVVAKFSRNINTAGTDGTLLGYYDGANSFLFNYRVNNSQSNRLEMYYGGQGELAYQNGNDFIVDLNKNVWNIYDFNNSLLYSKTFAQATFEILHPTPIMGCVFSDGTELAHAFCRLYYIKIYDNDKLIYDVIPVKDKNGVVCGYNKVDGTFMYNAGPGEFIGGNPVKLKLQSKEIEITENGTIKITPDEGYTGLKEVDITTNISNSVKQSNDLNIFMQEIEPSIKEGVWLQCNKSYTKIYFTSESEEKQWNVEKMSTPIPFSFYAGYGAKIGDYMYLFSGNTTYKYNFANQTYNSLANIPVNFQYAGGCFVGTDVYLLAGAGSSSVSSASYLYKYDTLTNTYTKLANRPIPSTGSKIVAVGNTLYSWGCDWNTSYAGKGYKYDIATNTWSEIAKPPRYQCYGGIVSYGTDVYILGSAFTTAGSTGEESEKSWAYKYDTLSDTYTRITDVPNEVFTSSYMNTLLVDDDIYIFSVRRDDYSVVCNYKYNITNDEYIKMYDLPVPIKRSWALCLADNTIYVFGGEDTQKDVYKINLSTGITDFENNSIIINLDATKESEIQFNLSGNLIFENSNLLYFYANDISYHVSNGEFDDTIPVYYGDGTQWIKFKN